MNSNDLMFLLKKIVSQLFLPIPLILCFLLIGLILLWFTKRQLTGKILISLGALLTLVFSTSIPTVPLVRPLENKYKPDDIQLADKHFSIEEECPIKFVVVLGAGHTTDDRLPITSQINEDSLVRLIEGIRIYRKYPDMKLILSGGRLFDPNPTATVMAKLAMDLGVQRNDIILESKSKDTQDEAKFIKDIVKDDPFFLVTSAAHMPRSMSMFKKLAMKPIPAPAGHQVKIGHSFWPYLIFPGARSIVISEEALHEYLGIVWAKLRGQI
ncbi:MAG: envelope biogenesis factor ElyC [Nitrospirota bacterium]